MDWCSFCLAFGFYYANSKVHSACVQEIFKIVLTQLLTLALGHNGADKVSCTLDVAGSITSQNPKQLVFFWGHKLNILYYILSALLFLTWVSGTYCMLYVCYRCVQEHCWCSADGIMRFDWEVIICGVSSAFKPLLWQIETARMETDFFVLLPVRGACLDLWAPLGNKWSLRGCWTNTDEQAYIYHIRGSAVSITVEQNTNCYIIQYTFYNQTALLLLVPCVHVTDVEPSFPPACYSGLNTKQWLDVYNHNLWVHGHIHYQKHNGNNTIWLTFFCTLATERWDVRCVWGVDSRRPVPLQDLYSGVSRWLPEGAGLPACRGLAGDERHSPHCYWLELLLLCKPAWLTAFIACWTRFLH